MIRQQQTKGVSPVIGVILMVAITVIIAAVVANFVLGLTDNLEENPDATITFNQQVDSFGSETYQVNVTVSQMDNADYLVVKEQTEDTSISTEESYSGPSPGDSGTDYAPDSASASASASNDNAGVILLNQGDEASIQGLTGDMTVQVYGALDGSETLIQSYEVKDTLN